MEWDYKKRTVKITMPDYVKKALARFQHKFPNHPQHSTHPCAKINYGEKVEYVKETMPTEPRVPLDLFLKRIPERDPKEGRRDWVLAQNKPRLSRQVCLGGWGHAKKAKFHISLLDLNL